MPLFPLPRGAPLNQGAVSGGTVVSAWEAAVVANGGTVSAGRKALLTAYVDAQIVEGIWQLIDDCWFITGENEPQAYTSLKQRRLATAIAGPLSFTIDRGVAFNGTTQALATGFTPSSHCIAGNGSNIRIGVYERTNVGASTTAFGNIGQAQLFLRPRNASNNVNGRICSNAVNFPDAVADSRGYTTASKITNSTTLLDYKNGVAGTTVVAAAVATGLPSQSSMYIGAASATNGSVSTPRASTIGFCVIGAPLSAAQELADYNALQTFMTAIGANV